MAPDDGSVRITAREIYDTLQHVKSSVDLLVLGVDELRKGGTDHEVRLRSVERKVYAIPSFAVLIAVAGLVVSILTLSGREPSNVQTARAPITTPSTQPHATAPVSPTTADRARTPEAIVQTPEKPAQSTPTTTPPRSTPTVPTLPPIAVPAPVLTLAQRLEALVPVEAVRINL